MYIHYTYIYIYKYIFNIWLILVFLQPASVPRTMDPGFWRSQGYWHQMQVVFFFPVKVGLVGIFREFSKKWSKQAKLEKYSGAQYQEESHHEDSMLTIHCPPDPLIH